MHSGTERRTEVSKSICTPCVCRSASGVQLRQDRDSFEWAAVEGFLPNRPQAAPWPGQFRELSLPDKAKEEPVTESSYPWGEPFQLRLLALLLQQPEKVSGLVEAQFFTSPMLVDIARVLQETHRKYPGSRVSRATLGELVRQTLGRKEDEYWPSYKAQIKRIFRTALTDTPWLLEQAKQFAKEIGRASCRERV